MSCPGLGFVVTTLSAPAGGADAWGFNAGSGGWRASSLPGSGHRALPNPHTSTHWLLRIYRHLNNMINDIGKLEAADSRSTIVVLSQKKKKPTNQSSISSIEL